jgi:hypothetical protein
MDSTVDIRKRIHDFIDIADERILRIFKGIIDAEERKIIIHKVPDYIYDRIEEEREIFKRRTSTLGEVKERLMKKL